MAEYDFEKAKEFDKGQVALEILDSRFMKVEMTAKRVDGEVYISTVLYTPDRARFLCREMMRILDIRESNDKLQLSLEEAGTALEAMEWAKDQGYFQYLDQEERKEHCDLTEKITNAFLD